MKKTIYSYRDGLALLSVAVAIANVTTVKDADGKPAQKADVKDVNTGATLVHGALFSEKPADGCWSEIEEYVPGPPAPDERDAQIQEMADGFKKFEEHHNKVVGSKNAEIDALKAKLAEAEKSAKDALATAEKASAAAKEAAKSAK